MPQKSSSPEFRLKKWENSRKIMNRTFLAPRGVFPFPPNPSVPNFWPIPSPIFPFNYANALFSFPPTIFSVLFPSTFSPNAKYQYLPFSPFCRFFLFILWPLVLFIFLSLPIKKINQICYNSKRNKINISKNSIFFHLPINSKNIHTIFRN